MSLEALSNQQNFKLKIDFDFTLFDSNAFGVDLRDELVAQSGLTTAEVAADIVRFHKDPVLGGYDFDAHIAAYELNPHVMWSALQEIVHGTNYLYEDSAIAIQELRGHGYNPSILSFGMDRFQRAKIKPNIKRLIGDTAISGVLSPELPFDIIFQRKSDYISSKYPVSMAH